MIEHDDTERAAFEAAMRAEYNLAWCESLFAREGEDYSNPATQLAFAAWRLRREALRKEIYTLRTKVEEMRTFVLAELEENMKLRQGAMKFDVEMYVVQSERRLRKVASQLLNDKEEGVVVPRECEWSYDDADSAWLTSCGEEFCFMDGGPNENKAKFCQYCGGKINVSADASELGQLAGEGE